MGVAPMRKDQDSKQELVFRKERLLDNMSRMLLITKVYVVVIVLIGIVNIGITSFSSFHPNFPFQYMVVYTSFCLFNVYCFYIVNRQMKVSNCSVKHIDKWEKIIVVYITISMTYGAIISVMDQVQYQDFMVYTLCMLLCAVLFYTSINQILLPIIIATTILVVGIPIAHHDFYLFYLQLYFVALIVIITFILSRVVYRDYLKSYKTKEQWLVELKRNAILTDQLQKANRQLSLKAYYDELTGIYNRHGFQRDIQDIYRNRAGKSIDVTIILIDIDYFKNYNDHHGHNRGDNTLRSIAQAIADTVQEYDCIPVRWGGEEFVVVGRDLTEEQVHTQCKLIEMAISKLFILHENSPVSNIVTVSIGACTLPCSNSTDVETVIKSADKALYKVKKSGRNNYSIV
jgi:diguanylate cyclase (GGDEF)-like protein